MKESGILKSLKNFGGMATTFGAHLKNLADLVCLSQIRPATIINDTIVRDKSVSLTRFSITLQNKSM